MRLLVAALSWATLLVGVVLDLLVWFRKIATKEPPLVLHLSCWALIWTGLTNVLVV